MKRRTILGWAVALPATWAAGTLASRTRRTVAMARPPRSGTSSTRCGTCGRDGHTMLHCADQPQLA